MNDRCTWNSKSAGRGVCDRPCEGRYCERHAKVAAVRDAGAELRAAREAVAKARDAVVIAAKVWSKYAPQDARDDAHIDNLQRAVTDLRNAECAEAEARARLEALR